jgi:hypothetical protein
LFPNAAQYRWGRFKDIKNAIDVNEGGFDKFSQGEGCSVGPLAYV